MSRHRPTAVVLLVGALLLGWWILQGEKPAEPLLPADAPLTPAERAAPPLLAGRAARVPSAAPGFAVPSATRDPERLEAGPGWVVLRGRVVDETGAGVAGAKIHVCPQKPPRDFWFLTLDFSFGKVVTSPSEGAFEVRLPVGKQWIVLARPTAETSPSTPQLVGDAANVVTLRVQRAANLGGVVLGTHGAPAAGHVVHVATAGWPLPQEVAADMEGRFVARIAPQAAGVTLRVGWLEDQEQPKGAALGDRLYDVQIGRTDLVLRLHEPVFLRGTVRGFDGRELRGGSIHARRADGGPDAISLSADLDGKRGTFALGPLRPGEWVLVALPGSGAYAMSEDTPAEAPTTEARILCPLTPGIHGCLEGDDVEGFHVTWQDAHTPIGERSGAVKVSSDGSFHIPGLRNAPHHLYAWRRGDPRMAEVRAARPDAHPLPILLEQGLSIEGAFHEGNADGGRRVIARRGGLEIDGFVDKHGRFRVTGLSPGEWQLHTVLRSSSLWTISILGRSVYAGSRGVRLGD